MGRKADVYYSSPTALPHVLQNFYDRSTISLVGAILKQINISAQERNFGPAYFAQFPSMARLTYAYFSRSMTSLDLPHSVYDRYSIYLVDEMLK
jgi:hypothetical protein